MFIICLDNLYPGANLVKYIKFTTIISLFLAAANIKKSFPEQQLLTLAVFFAMTADFFLVFCSTFPSVAKVAVPWGVLGFFIAYLINIKALQKGFSLGLLDMAAALLQFSVFLYFFSRFAPLLNGINFLAALAFGLVLSYMTWTAVSTLFRSYFSLKVSVLLALAGILMFICDIGVAYNMLFPPFRGCFIPWLQNIIWGAYIPAWMLVVVVCAEENLLAK